MQKFLLVMSGGALGAVCRYGTTLLAGRLWGTDFPWGTLAVNWAGCLFVGIAFALADSHHAFGHSARLFFVTGFLGALTTFSSFALESVNLARPSGTYLALTNLLAHNAGGVALVMLGIWIVRAGFLRF